MPGTKLAAFRLDATTRADLRFVAETLGYSQTEAVKRLVQQKADQLRTVGQQPAPWRRGRPGAGGG